jgi:acyl carrier protein
MDEQPIYAIFSEILGGILGKEIPVLSASTTPTEIDGWDSFITVNLVVAIERRFAFKMAASDFRMLTCVGDFVAVIARSGGAGSSPADGGKRPRGRRGRGGPGDPMTRARPRRARMRS